MKSLYLELKFDEDSTKEDMEEYIKHKTTAMTHASRQGEMSKVKRIAD
jgi:hypothetical protein